MVSSDFSASHRPALSVPISHAIPMEISLLRLQPAHPEALQGRAHTAFRPPPCHSESAHEDRRIWVRGESKSYRGARFGFQSWSFILPGAGRQHDGFRLRACRSRNLGGAGLSVSHPDALFIHKLRRCPPQLYIRQFFAGRREPPTLDPQPPLPFQPAHPKALEGRAHTAFRPPPCHSESAREDRRIWVRGESKSYRGAHFGFQSWFFILPGSGRQHDRFRVRACRSRNLGGAGLSVSHPDALFIHKLRRCPSQLNIRHFFAGRREPPTHDPQPPLPFQPAHPKALERRAHTAFRHPPCHSESAREDRRIWVRGESKSYRGAH